MPPTLREGSDSGSMKSSHNRPKASSCLNFVPVRRRRIRDLHQLALTLAV